MKHGNRYNSNCKYCHFMTVLIYYPVFVISIVCAVIIGIVAIYRKQYVALVFPIMIPLLVKLSWKATNVIMPMTHGMFFDAACDTKWIRKTHLQ